MKVNPLFKQLTYPLGILLLVFSACKKSSSPDTDGGTPVKQLTKEEVTATINNALIGKDTLSSFAAQMKLTVLTDAEVKDVVTVFAPSNEAYKLKVSSIKLASTAPAEILPDSSSVRDYIIPGNLDFTKAQSGATYTTLSGKKLTLTKTGSIWYLNGIFLNATALANANGATVYAMAALLNASTIPHVTGTSDIKTFPGWLLTIYGRNLATTLTGNMVQIDGKSAQIHVATTDSLIVTVPQGASAGAITVTVRGRILTAPQNVTIQQAQVSSVAGTSGGPIQGIAVNDAGAVIWTDNKSYGASTLPRLGTYQAGQVNYYSPSFANPNNDGTFIFPFTNSFLWAIAVDHNNKVYYANQAAKQGLTSYIGIWQSGFSDSELLRADWWAGKSATSTSATTKDKLLLQTSVLAVDAQNAVYLSNAGLIQQISPAGNVSTLISSANFKSADANVAKDVTSYGIAFSSKGTMYIGDESNGRVWVKDANGLKVLAGNNTAGAKDGTGTAAQFGTVFGLTVDKKGNVYVCDNDYSAGKYLIRMINPMGVVTTIAGNANNTFTDGVGTTAGFNGVNTIAADNKGVLYVGTDVGVVKKISIQ